MNTFVSLFPFTQPLQNIAELSQTLETYKKFVEIGINAIENFTNGDLIKFDAHVGDASCQIRAYRIFLLFQKKELLNLTCIKENLFATSQNIDAFLKNPHIKKYFRKGILFKKFTESTKLDFVIHSDLSFIFQAYYLTQISIIEDEYKLSAKVDYINYLRLFPTMPKSFFKRFVKSLQRNLSEDSTKFTFSLASNLIEFKDLRFIQSELIKEDNLNRKILPAFLTGSIIFKHILKSGFDILLFACVYNDDKITNKISIPLQTNLLGDDFIASSALNRKRPYFVIKGEVRGASTKEEIIQMIIKDGGFMKVFSGTMAAHRQYAGVNINDNILEQFYFLFKNLNSSISVLFHEYQKTINLGLALLHNNSKSFLACHIFSAKINTLSV